MPDGPTPLEYAFHLPVAPPDDWRFSLTRLLALGYVAACVFGLLLMGVLMALQI